MRSIFPSALVLFTVVVLQGQDYLYRSDSFTITTNKVVQGQYEATIHSPVKLTTNYQSTYSQPTKRTIDFKFSIDGHDNERYPGEDHHAILFPEDGKYISSLYKFGNSDPYNPRTPENEYNIYLEEDTYFTIRADMRHVLADFNSKGYYETFNSERIMADEFTGLYVAGGTHPLTWEFPSLPSRPELKMTDPDGDGIYEVTILIKQFQEAAQLEGGQATWSLQQDITRFPHYSSSQMISDALYNLSLEELLQDIRMDGTFMAGAKWPGVWTRDISYSILLSLAIISPEESKKSLMAKVDYGRIIQDTGTGGSWPVSSDRMIWALAAWEIYTVTGDRDWLEYAYGVIKTSAESDLKVVYNRATGLVHGESSFLDWREQTYPRWMDPKDIYTSQNLGTNAVHYRTYEILAEMADILGDSGDQYLGIAASIKKGMNTHLLMPDKGYYGQYLYGRNYLSLSPRSESLGEALAVLFDIADEPQQRQIIERMPVLTFGTPCIYPQIPNIPPYHNNGIWPFVCAYRTWAAAKVANMNAVEHGLASIYRPAALFLTNKENMVASTGDYMGTEINSDRQLWSVAGNLAMVYRILFGMSFTPDALTLAPAIPKVYGGTRSLKNFRYRDALLTITIQGFGSEIASVEMDGKLIQNATIPGDIKGEHHFQITMANDDYNSQPINLVGNKFSPATPSVSISEADLRWETTDATTTYFVYQNGELLGKCSNGTFPMPYEKDHREWQVLAVDEGNSQSFLSEPVDYIPLETIRVEVQPKQKNVLNHHSGYSGKGYIELVKAKDQKIRFVAKIKQPGLFSIDFRYANGHGPINTNNKCTIRTLTLDGEIVGPVVLPQRGVQNWTNWGYSNAHVVYLSKGRHELSLAFTDANNNMNQEVNSALLDHVRLTLLSR